ncbi:hypothetical protein NPIL_92581 [Nephila pilipes]|uniref:Uncharacterized protein n=1 Tax=Nephila pilipes TaxID=299642 RepID=A0A8X6TW72_NEPPI|nr:hypothetical protein NPIL_92581 [Nephila pilipes]
METNFSRFKRGDSKIPHVKARAKADVSYDDFDHHPPRYRPQRINALCRLTNFTKSEIKLIYQGFKQVGDTKRRKR